MLAKQLAEVIRTQDLHETADDVMRRFGPRATFTADAADPPPDSPDAGSGTTLTSWPREEDDGR